MKLTKNKLTEIVQETLNEIALKIVKFTPNDMEELHRTGQVNKGGVFYQYQEPIEELTLTPVYKGGTDLRKLYKFLTKNRAKDDGIILPYPKSRGNLETPIAVQNMGEETSTKNLLDKLPPKDNRRYKGPPNKNITYPVDKFLPKDKLELLKKYKGPKKLNKEGKWVTMDQDSIYVPSHANPSYVNLAPPKIPKNIYKSWQHPKADSVLTAYGHDVSKRIKDPSLYKPKVKKESEYKKMMGLTEAPNPIHHSQAKFFWVHKSQIKKASKLLLKKFPPKGGYHRVEIAGKTGRVPGHFAITTDKRTFNDALELLAKNKIKVRGS